MKNLQHRFLVIPLQITRVAAHVGGILLVLFFPSFFFLFLRIRNLGESLFSPNLVVMYCCGFSILQCFTSVLSLSLFPFSISGDWNFLASYRGPLVRAVIPHQFSPQIFLLFLLVLAFIPSKGSLHEASQVTRRYAPWIYGDTPFLSLALFYASDLHLIET